ncbi:hypothetical protein ACLOJK_028555 [Asimina triloba]
MARLLLRRSISLQVVESPIILSACNILSRAFRALEDKDEMKSSPVTGEARKGVSGSTSTSSHSLGMAHLFPLLPSVRDQSSGLDIELVDPCLWQVSSIFFREWNRKDHKLATSNSPNERADEVDNHLTSVEDDTEFDQIEDMRHCGNLFYKLDRNSLEFEEYNIVFRKKHAPKKNKEKQVKSMLQKESNNREESNKNKEKQSKKMLGRETRKKEDPKTNSTVKHAELTKQKKNSGRIEEASSQLDGKRKRSPTYNQLTGPYHEPFCLDIFISKSSVRACIVHRVTSKVVAVAHSISKDMKYDLASTKDTAACNAVGAVLAQRAIADDIYNVVYTPRKGDKLEGKLEVVLQSIISNEINVKVKIKQRKALKVLAPSTAK